MNLKFSFQPSAYIESISHCHCIFQESVKFHTYSLDPEIISLTLKPWKLLSVYNPFFLICLYRTLLSIDCESTLVTIHMIYHLLLSYLNVRIKCTICLKSIYVYFICYYTFLHLWQVCHCLHFVPGIFFSFVIGGSHWPKLILITRVSILTPPILTREEGEVNTFPENVISVLSGYF